MYTQTDVYVHRWMYMYTQTDDLVSPLIIYICAYINACGLATVSRIGKIIGLFCRNRLFYRALLQKRPIIFSILLTVATPYVNILYIYAYINACI